MLTTIKERPMHNNKSKERSLIIGLGTGRCGTQSLARLLSLQKHYKVKHELGKPLPWAFSLFAIEKKVEELKCYNGDIAFYYLNYVRYLKKNYPNIKFVCLKRDRNETIESYLIKSEDRNNWLNHNETQWKKSPVFYNSYPKYNVQTKREALEQYYDDYYKQAEIFAFEFPGLFKVFPMQYLNTDKGVTQILSHCGFTLKEMILNTDCHFNKNEK